MTSGETITPSISGQLNDTDDVCTREQMKKNPFQVRTRLFHSYVTKRNIARAEKLRIKQLVKKFFKTYSFTRVKSVVDHPDFYKEFCTVTDGVLQLSDKTILIMQYQRPDGNHSKKYPLFTTSRFWNDSKEEPLHYQKGKFGQTWSSVLLQYKQSGGSILRNAIVGSETVLWYPKSILAADDPKHVVTKYAIPIPDDRKPVQGFDMDNDRFYYYRTNIDFRNPEFPQIGQNWLLYIVGSHRSLIGIKFSDSVAQDVTLHVLVAEGVECFSLDHDQFFAIQKGSSVNLSNIAILKDLSIKGRTESGYILTNFPIFLPTDKFRIASDISINNEFTCIRHLKSRLIFIAAMTDHINGQNYLFAGHHLDRDRFYKILEIQSLQVTSRTTPIRHAKLISPTLNCSFAILSEDNQIHVCYFLTDLRFFGVLQFNVPVGSDEAEVYSLDVLNSNDVVVSGYDVLEVYRLRLILN